MVNPIITSHWFRPIITAAAGLGVLLFVVALVSQTVFHTSIDPTEQGFAVTLHNDTVSTVFVKQCDATCSSFHEIDRLPPAGSVEVNTSSGDVANWWVVSDATGRTIGCLPLRYHHKINGLIVNVSRSTTCPAGTSGLSSGGPSAGVTG